MSISDLKVMRLDDSERVPFADNSFYQPIVTGESAGFPIFTGIQTAEPGYATPAHAHPYIEILHVLEGALEAWLVGEEHAMVRLEVGDTIALPPDRPHIFRVAGEQTLRLLGTHTSPRRVVQLSDGEVSVMGVRG